MPFYLSLLLFVHYLFGNSMGEVHHAEWRVPPAHIERKVTGETRTLFRLALDCTRPGLRLQLDWAEPSCRATIVQLQLHQSSRRRVVGSSRC